MIDARSAFVLLLAVCVTPAQAADVVYSQSSQTQASDSHTQIESAEASARRFGLTSEDWTRYEEIMKGEGRFHWSHLDPVWVLSIYAESDAERLRYARLAARQEHERTRKLLQFKDAYVAAFQSMYGHEPIMDLEGFQARYRERQMNAAVSDTGQAAPSIKGSASTQGDRMVLFMATNGCPTCDALFMRLSKQQTPGVVLDVHFVGDTETNITAWAKRMGIEPADIQDGHITLNNGSAMYAQYGNPSLPAAYYFDASDNQVLSIRESGKP